MASSKRCSHEGCDRAHYARGFCNLHYQQWKRENPDGTVPHGSLTLEERFWRKVNFAGPIPERIPEAGPCWVWTGAINKWTGYGNFGKPQKLPHRVSFELLVGEIPEGLQLDHLCKNRACVNPEHLEPVAPKENQYRSDGVAGVNHRKKGCDSGHPFTEENTLYGQRGRRYCRTCAREKMRRFRLRKGAVDAA